MVVKRDDLLGNVERADWFEEKRNLDKYGKPVDPTEWGMTPPTGERVLQPAAKQYQLPCRDSAASVL